ncbi:MAG TPA: hypothetical protein VHF69_12540, partial [Candidatus Synoicihabitans sp.]|nr:hypothetical protein [Candidatus Synoicihabitans sp.]
SPDTLWVHLYAPNSLETSWSDGARIKLRQNTDYPWAGTVKLTIDEAPKRPIALKLRVPGWTAGGARRLTINGQAADAALEPGTYATVTRAWQAGDVVELALEVVPRLLESNPLVEETLNQAVLQVGPLVYCLEENDLPAGVALADVALSLQENPREFRPEPLQIVNTKVVAWKAPALNVQRTPWRPDELYREFHPGVPQKIDVRFVPYYAWGNRGDTDMSVWLPVR